MAVVNRRLRRRELTPEELEEQQIKEEVFLETSGFSSREEYEAHQREMIREINECIRLEEDEEFRKEYYENLESSACCREPQVRGGKCVNCGAWISDEADLPQVDNEC